MAIYLLDGVMCPAFYLTGDPRRAAYIYDTPEGQNDLQIRVSNSLVFVPDDDGASWTAETGPTGAHMVLAAPDDLDTGGLQQVYNRLLKAYDNKERCANERLGTEAYTPGPVFATPEQQAQASAQDNRPLWQKLGFASKEEWRAAGKPQA